MRNIIGIPKEIKTGEGRVGLSPEVAAQLAEATGYSLLVGYGAGEQAGYMDDDYNNIGAAVVSRSVLFHASKVIVKVKELMPEEFRFVRDGQAVAGFFHLPANKPLKDFIARKNLPILSYEKVFDEQGRRPILAPMSKIAGELAAKNGLAYLKKNMEGIKRCSEQFPRDTVAVIIGKGSVGMSAARTLRSFGVMSTHIYLLDKNTADGVILSDDDMVYGVLYECNEYNLKNLLSRADLVIGAAAIPGQPAPRVITEEMIASMHKGGVFVDPAIDEGGISATSKPTSLAQPVYNYLGITHYCVPNMPGSDPVRATTELSQAALPYLIDFIKGLK